MIDPSVLVDNLVAMLQDIPDLVEEMGGDATRIYAYHDAYPARTSLSHAIHQMPAPSVMVAWMGTAPGTLGTVEVWKHHVTGFLRAPESTPGDPPAAYYRLFKLVVKGKPTSSAQKMLYADVHPSCQPMDLPMVERQTDAEGLDYFQIPMTFTEIGDDD